MTNSRAPQPRRLKTDRWRITAHRRLAKLLETAQRLPVDESSRILFLSDCHRGDGGPTDDLGPNRRLYLDVLNHYHRRGFTYVEVGDGDELWKNRRLAPIVRAHRPIYDLLHEFHRQGRLYLILGNHDRASPFGAGPTHKEGIPTREALVLQHTGSGQEVLVMHGHQVDFEYDPGMVFSRLGVRYFWRPLQQMGYWRNPDWTEMVRGRSWLGRTIARSMIARNKVVEARLKSWLARSSAGQPTKVGRSPALLCGHTHAARSPGPDEPAYFSTGCCIVPGQITGIELQANQLSLVKWTDQSGPERELLASPRRLADLT